MARRVLQLRAYDSCRFLLPKRKPTQMNKFAALCIAGLLTFTATAARADVIYSLDVSGCSSTCSPAPFGEVILHAISSTEFSVTVSLTQGTSNIGEKFAN